ncbi:MAG: hypothetical protein Q9183_001916, partial [Haloplaca sp. 2 TL-2023]
MLFKYLTLVSLSSLACAHFTLDYPPSRGDSDDSQGEFPCGGLDVSTDRTPWPLAGGTIQLTLGHARSAIQVLIALGNDVTTEFNTVLVPTIQEEGLGEFCFGDVAIPESLMVQEGDNATIQVVTNGESTQGLYN